MPTRWGRAGSSNYVSPIPESSTGFWTKRLISSLSRNSPNAVPATHRGRPGGDVGGDWCRFNRCSVRRRARGGAASRAGRSPQSYGRDRGRAVGVAHGGAKRRGRLGPVFYRWRDIPPSHPGGRRPPDPARRVLDLLHAITAGNLAGHFAMSIRVPDPGRAADRDGGRQRLTL